MTTNIRISRTEPGEPKRGFAGAIGGGYEIGPMNEVSIDTDITDAAELSYLVEQAGKTYRESFTGTDSPVVVHVPAEFVDKVRAVNIPSGAVIMPDELRTPEGDN